MSLPKKLQEKLKKREENFSLRSLPEGNDLIDFSSNDYLGISRSEKVFKAAHQYLVDNNFLKNGSSGSRLISGNHQLYKETEQLLCDFHQSESAVIFNSGYDANIGFFSSVPQKGDVILYDEYAHASIRDGILMSNAKAYKFKHNDVKHLDELLQRHNSNDNLYVATESVFSMDGDSPDLKKLHEIVQKNDAHLIVDEAHATGVFGASGAGLVQDSGIKVFARIVTFGKALGNHGAVVLGSNELKNYLINFARSLIYTTALPPHSLATILFSYKELKNSNSQDKLTQNINFLKKELARLKLQEKFIPSQSAIHSCVLQGNKEVKEIALKMQQKGFDVKAILSPTVPKGQERIRFCLHSYNSFDEITDVLETLRIFVS